eukprot:247860_1
MFLVPFLIVLCQITVISQVFQMLDMSLPNGTIWPCIFTVNDTFIAIDTTSTNKSFEYTYDSVSSKLIQHIMDIGWDYPSGTIRSSTLLIYDIELKQFRDLQSYQSTPLNPSHLAPSMVLVHDKIYMIGGFKRWSGNEQINSVAIYDISNDSWAAGPNMLTLIALAGVAFSNITEKIYLFGGSAATTRTSDTIYSLHTISNSTTSPNQWVQLSSKLKQSRNSHTCKTWNDVIFCIGGRIWECRKTGSTTYCNYWDVFSIEKFDIMNEQILDIDININQARTFPSLINMNIWNEIRLLAISGISIGGRLAWYRSAEILVSTYHPTTSPTDSTRAPTENPSNYPTISPTEFTISPTENPSNDPTTKPTKQIQYIYVTRTGIDNTYQMYIYVASILSILTVIIGIVGYFHANKNGETYEFHMSSLFRILLYLLDSISDFFFCINIYYVWHHKKSTMINLIVFIASIMFLIIPPILSLFEMERFISRSIERYHQYFTQHSF